MLADWSALVEVATVCEKVLTHADKHEQVLNSQEAMNRRTLARREKVLGSPQCGHLDRITSGSYLGVIHRNILQPHVL